MKKNIEMGELAAFDAITAEVNETKRRLLFGKYSLKTKAYIINRMKMESEKLIRANEKSKENLQNIEKQINHSQNNLKCLRKATNTIQNSNCEKKKDLLLMQLRKEKLEKNMEDIKNKYTQKWSEYEKEYESTPLAQERHMLQNEIKLNTFLLEKAKYEKADCKEALEKWHSIKKSRKQRTIIDFADYMVSWPHKLKIISEKRMNLHALLSEVNELTKERRVIRAQLEDMKLSHTLRMIQSPTFIPKRLAMQMNINIIDDLPNLCDFSATFHSEVSLLQMPKLSQQQRCVENVTHQSKKEIYFSISNASNSDNQNTQNVDDFRDPFDTRCTPKTNDTYQQEHDDDQHREECSPIIDDQVTDGVPQYPVIDNSFSINNEHDTNNTATLAETEAIVTNQTAEEVKESKNDDSKKITILENRILSQNTFSNIVYNTFKNTNLGEVKNIGRNDNIEIATRPLCQDLQQHDEDDEEQKREEEQIPQTETLSNDTIVESELPTTTPFVKSDINAGHNDSLSSLCAPGADQNLNISGEGQLNLSCISAASTESYKELKEKLLQKYQLNKSPKFVYAKNIRVLPKFGDEKQSKYFPKKEHENLDVKVKVNDSAEDKDKYYQNKAMASTDDKPTSGTEVKQSKCPKKVNQEDQEVRKPTDPLSTLMFGSGIPLSLSENYETQLTDQDDDSITDFTKMLETPADLLLSPRYEEPEPETQEVAKDPPPSSGSFLFGLGHMKKTAFGMFGDIASTSKDGAGNSKPAQQDDFSFNFGASPETKRKKSGFFSLFNN